MIFVYLNWLIINCPREECRWLWHVRNTSQLNCIPLPYHLSVFNTTTIQLWDHTEVFFPIITNQINGQRSFVDDKRCILERNSGKKWDKEWSDGKESHVVFTFEKLWCQFYCCSRNGFQYQVLLAFYCEINILKASKWSLTLWVDSPHCSILFLQILLEHWAVELKVLWILCYFIKVAFPYQLL